MDVFQSLLNHTFSIARQRRTPDGRGGWAIDYVPLGTALGRLRPASSTEREAAMLEERQITHVLYLVYGADIARGDQVEGGGLVVEVEGVREPSTAHEHLEIDCVDRQFAKTTEESGS